ncbi:glycosyltransferase family 39 protein [uncultured Paludibaculum sp.]|uniref:glycosyltransferase family 39 protein n=1 Tax=uncultured Paludibaculum sp. TaxID=1765020 RepID=UPI002AAA9A2B|nr:glycosyltransferase family 39 protein [uncultured Paludibaculum sp.]
MTSKRASKSSASSPRSRAARTGSRSLLNGLVVLAVLSSLSATAVWYVLSQGWTLWYGDAEAHLNIARRILDSRAAGYEQIGTVWLPLPHVLMMPLVAVDSLWRSGLGGAIVSAVCFVLAGLFLFLAVRRIFDSTAAAVTAVGAFALNPNLLYLQATPMTEPLSLCCATGLLYFCARFHDSRSWVDALLAGVLACCGTMARYEAWVLLPFVALYILLMGGSRRWLSAAIFCVAAGAGPLYWIAHNWILYSNPLEFYNGPWSAKAIYQRALDKGMAKYPGDHDWAKAWEYYRAAAELCVGRPLAWVGVAGLAAALIKRGWWAVLLLALTPAFYVLSVYSSGTPIFVPQLWPNSYYNTRYGLNLLPLACLGIAGLVALTPAKARGVVAVLLIGVAVAPWIGYPRKENWICWRESQTNSEGRRAWTKEAVQYLQPRYKPGAGIFMSFGDPTGILREAGIPIHESLHEGDGPLWQAAVARPDFFLWDEWVIAISGDRVSQAVNKLRRGPRRYECVRVFTAKDSPVVEVWRHIQ